MSRDFRPGCKDVSCWRRRSARPRAHGGTARGWRSFCRRSAGAPTGRAGSSTGPRRGTDGARPCRVCGRTGPAQTGGPQTSRPRLPARRTSPASTPGCANCARPAGCTTTCGCGSPRSGFSPCACLGSWARLSFTSICSMATRRATRSHGAGSPGCIRRARPTSRGRITSPDTRPASSRRRPDGWRRKPSRSRSRPCPRSPCRRDRRAGARRGLRPGHV